MPKYVVLCFISMLAVAVYGSPLTVIEFSNGTVADPDETGLLGPGLPISSVPFATPFNGPDPYGDSVWVSTPDDPGPEITVIDHFYVPSLAGFSKGFLDVAIRGFGAAYLNGTLLGTTSGSPYPGHPSYTKANLLFDISLYNVGDNAFEFRASISQSCACSNIPLLDYNGGAIKGGEPPEIPEPGTMLLFSSGGALFWYTRRRRRRGA